MTIDEKEELLVIFMEECAEAQVEASKIIRFGSSNAINNEVGDLLCMVELLKEYGLIDMGMVNKATKAKREKLKKWSNLKL